MLTCGFPSDWQNTIGETVRIIKDMKYCMFFLNLNWFYDLSRLTNSWWFPLYRICKRCTYHHEPHHPHHLWYTHFSPRQNTLGIDQQSENRILRPPTSFYSHIDSILFELHYNTYNLFALLSACLLASIGKPQHKNADML